MSLAVGKERRLCDGDSSGGGGGGILGAGLAGHHKMTRRRGSDALSCEPCACVYGDTHSCAGTLLGRLLHGDDGLGAKRRPRVRSAGWGSLASGLVRTTNHPFAGSGDSRLDPSQGAASLILPRRFQSHLSLLRCFSPHLANLISLFAISLVGAAPTSSLPHSRHKTRLPGATPRRCAGGGSSAHARVGSIPLIRHIRHSPGAAHTCRRLPPTHRRLKTLFCSFFSLVLSSSFPLAIVLADTATSPSVDNPECAQWLSRKPRPRRRRRPRPRPRHRPLRMLLTTRMQPTMPPPTPCLRSN
jgi:hypothetical protein